MRSKLSPVSGAWSPARGKHSTIAYPQEAAGKQRKAG